jgi:TolB-like protein/DNA-binding winged helix-turn-helix (wHTH) protein/Flp pilus assembly protein TadD
LALDAQYIDFLGYRLDRVARILTAPDGSDVALNARAFDVLCHLIEQRPRVVGKDELLAAAWPGRVVEENNLGQAISSLRRAFGTDANDHRFIRTVPGRGYSFVAEVGERPGASDPRMPPVAAARAPWWKRRVGRGAIVAILALALLGAWAWREHGTVAATDAASTTIAVLPFRSLDPRPGDDTLGLGISDTVITRLSGATRLRVLSLGSVQAMAGKTVDSLRAGKMLGANYLVEGHFQHQHDSVRVTARLLAMPDGRTLWAGTFDRREPDVFELQDEIASGVAAKLSQTYRAGKRSAGCMGDDPVAYRAYLRGYALINRPSPRTVEQADAAFREALARDPQCARALAGISQAARLRVMVSDGDPEVEFPNAEAAVARALKIDPDSAEAYSERGALLFWYRWNWPEAEASFQHAIELDPNLVAARISLAHLYSNLGRYDLAAAQARIAVALDPLSPIVNALAAAFIESTGQQREAHVHLQAALELEPDFWVALLHRGFASLFDGDRQAGERDLLRVAAETGRSTRSLVYLARFYVLDDRPEQARAILAELEARRAGGEYVLPSALAQVHLALGEKRQALDLLEEGYRHGDLGMAFLIDWFQDLAGEPRYATMLRALRLPPPPGEAPLAPPR